MSGRFWILFLCSLSAFVAGSLYSWSALSAPLARFLAQQSGIESLTSSDLSPAFALASSLTPLTMLISGFLSDRMNPKGIVWFGALAMGIGLYFCALAASPNDVVLFYGGLFGLGLGLVYGSLINYAVKLYPDRKGFAGGMVTAGYSLGSVVLPPVVTTLYLNIGIDGVFRLLGVVTAAVIVVGACFMKSVSETGAQVACGTHSSPSNLTGREMIGTRQFYIVYGFVVASSVPALTLLSHADYLSGEIARQNAYVLAWLTSIFGIANVFGRMSAGVVSDWVGRKAVLLMSLLMEILGLLLLMLHAEDCLLFGAVFVLVGCAFGCAMGVIPAWVSDQFGLRYAGLNYGIIITGVSVAGILGPMGFLYLEQTLSSRSLTLTSCIAVLCVIAASVFADKKIR